MRAALRMAFAVTLLSIAPAILLNALEDWPQFRGPGGQGHSSERGLPVEWGEQRNVAWKMPVPGRGWSSPIVAHGRVWVTTATSGRDGTLRLLGYAIDTGAEVLNLEVFRVGNLPLLNAKNSHASPTPVADSQRVYVHFGAEGTAAVNLDGTIAWKTRLGHVTQHGGGGSPILHGDLLIVNCDGADAAFVVALDTRTGKTRWKTWRREPWSQAYTTPLIADVDGRAQLISAGAHQAEAYDPANGKAIWRVSYRDGFSNVPRPVFGHGLAYIATGFQQPTLVAVRPDGRGDVTKSHVVWTLRRGAPLTPSPLLVGDDLYVVADNGILTRVDAKSGEVGWQQRVPGTFSASPVFADGRIYLQSEEGQTLVIAPGASFELLAANALDGPMLATMAISSESIFVRTATHLYRLAQIK